MFLCHACGNSTKPREQRTVLPIYYAGTPRQIKRECWLCPRCAQVVYQDKPSEQVAIARLNAVIAIRIAQDAEAYRRAELERIGEENYRRERDRMRLAAKMVKTILVPEVDHLDTPPVKPRGSYQLPESAPQPTLSELLRNAGIKPQSPLKRVKSHNAKCLVCGRTAAGGMSNETGVYCHRHIDHAKF